MSVHFFNYSKVKSRISYLRKDLEHFLPILFSIYHKELIYVNIVLISNKKMLALNKKYLNHNYYTDILTFFMDTKSIESDIFISYEMISYNADKYKVTFELEFLRLCIHGCLHLCGFTDLTDKDKRKMKSLENKYIRQFVSRGTVS